ncbi:BRCA1-associated RING domain protein 1-like [Mercenaria mercenaria]|uniref:BRCA1-associated RING domain protein 1-like n=1 Tax=Mercenaria mercenaria TaxID=6596 RepID=UPI00234FA88D|nr:BRCA1-associated RING domain protein 1-like [Mercenaria mercenaria]
MKKSASVSFHYTRNALASLEEKFKCHKCGLFASSPVTLGGCEHIFCNLCCEAYLGTACPVCSIPADVKDADVDRQLFNLASLCARLRQELAVDEKVLDNYKENEDPQIQCTPNQPIPGSASYDNTSVLNHDHVTDTKNRSLSKQVAGKKVVLSPATEGKTRIRKRKQQEKEETKQTNATKCSETAKRSIEKRDSKRAISKVPSPNEKSPNKRRKSLPIDQTTLTQFYDYDEDEEELNCSDKADDSENEKTTKSERKCRKTQKAINVPKTRLRHSLDSNIGKVTPEKVTPSAKSTSTAKKRKGKKKATEGDESALDVSVSDTGSVGQRTPVSAKSRSKLTGVHTPVINSEKQVSTPKGRQLGKDQRSAQSPALNKRNAKGETPLQVAAIKNDIDRVKQLLGEGANPNVRDNAGWTPLHEACNHGYLEIAKLLLDHGAMINIPGLENDTPLHDAINNGRVDCVKLLVSRGASLTLRNMHGHTAWDLAITQTMKKALETPVMSSADTRTSQPVDVLEYQTPCLMGTGLSREEKVLLQKAASQLQVKLLDEVTPEVTHIVTKFNSEGMCPRTIKIVQAILAGKWILNMEWLETSSQLGSLVCEEAFEAQGTSLFPHAQAPYKGRMNRKQQLPGLFDGCYFYFHGSFEYANPTKEDFISIVTAGGGKLLSREPKPGHLEMTLTVPYHADVKSELASCCVYIVHEANVKFKPIRTANMCSIPATWIMDCVANFKLLPLPDVS